MYIYVSVYIHTCTFLSRNNVSLFIDARDARRAYDSEEHRLERSGVQDKSSYKHVCMNLHFDSLMVVCTSLLRVHMSRFTAATCVYTYVYIHICMCIFIYAYVSETRC